MSIQDIILGSEEMPLWGIVIRVTVLYIALIVATRIMRERQVGILSGHNYLVAAGIVSLAAVRMVNPKSSLIEGVVIVFSYAIMNAFISYMDVKFPRSVDRIAIPLMLNGKIIKKNLAAVHITIDNLLGQLRLKEASKLSEIQEVYLEPTGKINVLKKAAASPVTKKQLNISMQQIFFPEVVIYDGVVQSRSLERAGYTLSWLEAQIARQYPGKPVQTIFLAILEAKDQLYIEPGEESKDA